MTFLRPRNLILLGLLFSVGGSALLVLTPIALAGFLGAQPGQDILVALEFALRVLASIIPPLGTALIAGGLVMLYIDKKFAERTES